MRPKFDENTESEAVPTLIRPWSPSKSHQLPCADVVASLGVLAPLRIDQSFASGSIDTLPDLPPFVSDALDISEIVITVLFTIEYLVRIATAPKKIGYILSFYGIVDLIAILPFYIALGVDLRAVRAFRLFRIIRILKLTRYGRAMERFAKALSYAKEEVVIFFIATIIILYLASVGMYYFEHDAQPDAFRSIFDSLWWAVATLTTVGYGDIYPVTVGGKIFTFVILMCGLGVVAVPAGLISAALSKVRRDEDRDKNE